MGVGWTDKVLIQQPFNIYSSAVLLKRPKWAYPILKIKETVHYQRALQLNVLIVCVVIKITLLLRLILPRQVKSVGVLPVFRICNQMIQGLPRQVLQLATSLTALRFAGLGSPSQSSLFLGHFTRLTSKTYTERTWLYGYLILFQLDKISLCYSLIQGQRRHITLCPITMSCFCFLLLFYFVVLSFITKTIIHKWSYVTLFIYLFLQAHNICIFLNHLYYIILYSPCNYFNP